MHSTDTTRQRFDQLAQTWDQKPSRVALARSVATTITELVPLTDQMDAMEYGCGTGLVTLFLASLLREVDAVDSSGEMLVRLREKIAEQGVKNIHPLPLDLEHHGWDRQILLSGTGYDLVLTSMTLHHITDPADLIQHFFSLIRPGGYLTIADLDREDGSFHGDTPDVRHHGFERDHLKALMATAGFEDVRAVTAHTIRRSRDDGTEARYPVFVACGRKV
ncbi:class I SAM-dependent DNA methyltransferase [Marinobacter gelidimuriae]|uniref:class I SAM-dependent DNA methyltransferase n=1 Tax=Marinobacter gelidimuriae TaxID=2739064 RepID=UPI0003817BE1|nr:class I SAM-dependent methyltransferase [Marinobacter gelidimuriae]